MAPARSPDTIRILVSSDNHVGYEGRDPIRKDDSWRTFDEIMQIAKKEDVDMVLLGGDLFHDNQPARKFMYQVMRSLRKNCLGMRPCELDFLSDAAEVFEGSAFPHVNYQDPDINISIPVFSIHGNHDEPSGDGHYCSLDLLQVAGLVNYFGRVPETDNVQAKPVLLQKGNTKLALYGLSNVREERMHHTFRSNKVHFYRPKQQQSDFFNLLVVHQNHYAHTANGYLPEEMLPDWMNLVVWGHEHECLIEPRENPQTKFHVMQPGSSVATSLVPGEAVTKQVAVVSITGTSFTSEAIPLKTVRPMVTRDLVLATDPRFKGLDKKKDNKQEVTKRLIATVEEMIEEATENWLSLRERDADDEDEDEQELPLPLIRLKVEYTALEGGKFEIENPQRFSNRFIGKVANTNDVVYFYRKKKNILGKLNKNGVVVPKEALEALEAAADGRDALKIEAIIREYFAAQSLRLLPQAPFGDAVSHFVNNSDKNRMTDFVVNELANQVQELLAMDEEEEGEDLGGSIERIRKKAEEDFLAGERRAGLVRRLKPKPADWDSDMEGHWVNKPDAYDKAPARESLATAARVQQAKTAAKPKAKSRAARDDEDDEDGDVHMDDDEEPEPRPKGTRLRTSAASKTTKAAAKKAEPAKKPPARTRKPTRGGFIDEDSDEDEQQEQEEDDVVMNDDEEDEFEAVARPAPAKKRAAAPAPKRTQSTATRARTAAKPAAKAKQTTLNFSQRPSASASAAVGRSQQTALEISDDEIEEDDGFESMPTMPTSRRR